MSRFVVHSLGVPPLHLPEHLRAQEMADLLAMVQQMMDTQGSPTARLSSRPSRSVPDTGRSVDSATCLAALWNDPAGRIDEQDEHRGLTGALLRVSC